MRLLEKYSRATEVKSRLPVAAGPGVPEALADVAGRVAPSELVYIRKSPDFCTADPRVGSLGTRGR